MATLSDVARLTRPSRALFTVYLVRSVGVAFGILFVIAFFVFKIFEWDRIRATVAKVQEDGLPVVALVAAVFLACYAIAACGFYVRFVTLRYRFDEDGFTRTRGLLFRHESFLAYARIQDAQVTQGAVERLFGIGTVALQTASGSKGFEETIEGLREFELVRDFLYERMKGKLAEAAGPP